MAEPRGIAYVNGELVPAAEAKISLFDTGFLGGVNVFDTLACWRGRIFKLSAHLDRFRRSAHAAGIPLGEAEADLEQVVVETVRRSGLRDAYVQVIATGGVRTAIHLLPERPTLIVYAVPYLSIVPPERVEQGISVMIPSIRNLPPTTLDPKIKTWNRLHTYMAKLEATRSGADEVILLDQQGLLTEGRSANVFLVRGRALFTPTEGILQGITRETVFEIAAEDGLPATMGNLTAYDLYAADEAFLATTAGGIIPIVRADGRTIGAGSPGQVTRRIADRYWERHVDGPDTTPVFEETVLTPSDPARPNGA